MQKEISTEWGYRSSIDGTGSKFTTKTKAINVGLKIISGGLMYGIGWCVGEALDLTPYINHAIPQAIQFATNLNVQDNIAGLTGIVCAAYGMKKSRMVLNHETLTPYIPVIIPITPDVDEFS